MLFTSIVTCIILLLVIVYPLFFTKNELLAEATGEASLEGVRKLKKHFSLNISRKNSFLRKKN